jgi:adenylate cyclase class 2
LLAKLKVNNEAKRFNLGRFAPMQKHLVEIKARTTRTAEQRALLLARGAEAKGTDHQIDHYFNVPEGRLKLRSGNIEHSLIFYRRGNQAGPKDSSVALTKIDTQELANSFATTLGQALGTWVKVDKQREIFFIGNVKFHLDEVIGLGSFIEIEAIGDAADQREDLLQQCQDYIAYLGVREDELVENSYSDMLIEPGK